MRILIAWLVVAAALAATSAAGAFAAGGRPAGTFSGCPRDTRPLPGPLRVFERPLRVAVLQFVHTSFRKISETPPSELVGARVRFVISVRDWVPSGWIKRECGLKVWRNSVAVDVYFPRLDKAHNPVGHCNACAHLTFLTARTSGGWTVWGGV